MRLGLHIAGVGVTQSHTLAQTDRMARDYIELTTGEEGASAHYLLQMDLGPLRVGVAELREAWELAVEWHPTRPRRYAGWSRTSAPRQHTLSIRHAKDGGEVQDEIGRSQPRVLRVSRRKPACSRKATYPSCSGVE
ncbi:hypothetical protein BH20ACT5_BH20ACT5_19650 [soil metagenome]